MGWCCGRHVHPVWVQGGRRVFPERVESYGFAGTLASLSLSGIPRDCSPRAVRVSLEGSGSSQRVGEKSAADGEGSKRLFARD